LAISRGLFKLLDEKSKLKLKQNNLLTIDSRKKERRIRFNKLLYKINQISLYIKILVYFSR